MDKRPAKTSPGFLKVTREQIAIPHAGRGLADDVNCLTDLEYRVMECLAYDTRFGGRSKLTNLEIGLAIGRGDGDGNKIARRIMRVIAGRRSHGKRLPGLMAKGFIKVRLNTNQRNSWQREIEVTAKWVDPRLVKLAEADPQESAPPAASPGTAVIAPATPAAQSDLPTVEQRDEVFGRLPRILTRPELAQRLVKHMGNRRLRLKLSDGAIKVTRHDDIVEPMSPAETAVLKWLREEVIAELSPQAAPDCAPESAPAATPRAAPRVANQKEIRGLIGRLSAGDDTDCVALADSLVQEFRDENPDLSRQTYLGIARDVARGELAQHVMTEAFEEACKPRKQNRGAAFVAEVRRLVAYHRLTSEGQS